MKTREGFVHLDGAQGEGGGQIVRTAVGLSLVTGRPVCLVNIRAKRRKPGLQRQHLAAVSAAAQLSRAETEGVNLGSTRLSFVPGHVEAGCYRIEVGSAEARFWSFKRCSQAC